MSRAPFSLLHLITVLCLLGTAATVAIPWLWSDRMIRREAGAVEALRSLAKEQHASRGATSSKRFLSGGELFPRLHDRGIELTADSFGQRDGYHFIVYLPAKEGGATRLAGNMDSEGAREHFAIYAWPIAYGISGRAVYAIDTKGRVFRTENAVDPYTALNPPPADLLGSHLPVTAFGPPAAWTSRVVWDALDG